MHRFLLILPFGLPRNICWKRGKAGCCRPSVQGRVPAAAPLGNAPPRRLSDGLSLARLPRLPPQQTFPGTRLQPMISVRMKKTKFSSLLSSPLPLFHHLRKLSVEFQIVIPTLNLRTATKERKLGQEDLGWDQTAHPLRDITHPHQEGGWLHLRNLFCIHIPSLQTLLYCLCSCDFDREIVIFINFLKISLSNVVSRTNFLPLRSGQKEVVYYPEAFSSWYTIMFAFCSEAKWLAKSFQQWAVLMSDFRGRGNSIILVSLKKAKSWVNSVTNPLNVLLAHVSMWLWEEGDLSLTFLTPWGVSCWTQWGPSKILMGMEPDHMASAAVLLLCSSSQKTLLPSYLGALVNLFPSLPLKERTLSGLLCLGGQWDRTQSYTGSG